MDLNRYKIYLSVPDSGSFTAAAAAWNYTPSGVVHLINALEQEFGFPLFVRTRRGVHLTTDGEQLVAPLRDLVQCDDRLRQVCSKIQGVLTGKVRIGSYYSISAHWLPPVIGRFHRDFPGVQIELMEGHHQLLEGVCVTVSGTGDPLLLGHFRSLLIPAVMRSISSSVFIRTICSL